MGVQWESRERPGEDLVLLRFPHTIINEKHAPYQEPCSQILSSCGTLLGDLKDFSR